MKLMRNNFLSILSDIMYNSTKNYIKQRIVELIEQCDDKDSVKGKVTIDDIKSIVEEIKFENMTDHEKLFALGTPLNKERKYSEVKMSRDEMIKELLEYGEAIDNLHTHTSVDGI